MKTTRTQLSDIAKTKDLDRPHRYARSTSLALALAALLAAGGTRGDILYVSTYDGNTIEKFDLATGAALGVFANGGLTTPTHMAFDSTGNLYVANSGDRAILEVIS